MYQSSVGEWQTSGTRGRKVKLNVSVSSLYQNPFPRLILEKAPLKILKAQVRAEHWSVRKSNIT